MLSGVASSGLAPAELTHINTTVKPPSEPMTMFSDESVHDDRDVSSVSLRIWEPLVEKLAQISSSRC